MGKACVRVRRHATRLARWLPGLPLALRLAWPLLLALSLAAPAHAQIGTDGAILGFVSDTSGGVLPGAAITVKNLDTGLTKNAVSATDGYFEIPALPRGWYAVTVALQGFSAWTVQRTELTIGERKRVSPQLGVGGVTEQVVVQAQQELLQTDRGGVETVIQQRQIRDLPGRNVVALAGLVPGTRYTGQGGPERAATIQGFGVREDQTEFQVDGLTANAGMDEGGITLPNPDTVEEIAVETSSFSAEHGRNPLQVVMVTKSGTNSFRGAAWEYVRNEALDAQNRNAVTKPRLDRHQFGFAAGGPIFRNRTFFFSSVEGIDNRGDRIYNNASVVTPAMQQGDFSAVAKVIRDPLHGNQPFAGNRIPADRISDASRYFLSSFLTANAPDGRFRAVAPSTTKGWESVQRLDHQLSDRQRIYGRWILQDTDVTGANYRPDYVTDNTTTQHNVGVNYNYMVSPALVITASAGYLKSDNRTPDPSMGLVNMAQEAGLRGFPTEGREDFIGLPNLNVTGWTGVNPPFGVPGRLWFSGKNAKVSASWVRGGHTVISGYEWNDRNTYGRHGSHSPRGSWDFSGQYTGDGFADFLLGLPSGTRRNFPLETFGMRHSPYSAAYVQDNWRLTSTLTLNLGVRYDYWHEKALEAGNGSTFDPRVGKVISGEVAPGQMDLTQQPVSAFLAAATRDLWVPASEVGVPTGLFEANGHVSPRVSLTWRPPTPIEMVVRGGYGVYYSSFRGNFTASSIVGLPYWTWEDLRFGPLSPTRWETAWPADPSRFIQPAVNEAPSWDIDPNKAQQWNVAVQTALPFRSALTLTYVGSQIDDQTALRAHNEVPPGVYPDLQAVRPYPAFGGITVLENLGTSWYHGLLVKLERRFSDGLTFMGSYALSKHTGDRVPGNSYGVPVPFAPAGYERGRTDLDRRHLLFVNGIYELPVGRDRKFLADVHPLVNAVAGGWQVSGIYSFTSGSPLTISQPGNTLGNGWSTRPDLVGDPSLSNPGAAQWFNTAAFAAAAPLAFGDSGIGIIDGPGRHILDLAIMKNFTVWGPRFLQVRAEAFNALNHSDLSNPNTELGNGNFGRITSLGGGRQVQLSLRFAF